MHPFGLDAVLNYRKRLEDLAQQRFFQAQKVRDTIAQRLHEEKQLLAELIATTMQKQVEGVEISELIFFEERISYVQNNIRNIAVNLTEKNNVVQKEHERLVQKSKDRRIMEKLKQKQNQTWQMYLNKKEAAMLDEIAVIKHDPQKND
jgi:flagellar FliJ protein